jgi:inorganic pyrophosphatase
MSTPYKNIPPFHKDGLLNVVIETKKQCRNKYGFDENLRAFRLKKILPFGMVFPYDFGFIPGTRGEDGDPLDVMVLMDNPVFAGCVVRARLIGVIQGEQTEGEVTDRNDRFVAIEPTCREFKDATNIQDLDKQLIKEVEQFFVQYNKLESRKYRLLGCLGADAARKMVKAGKR